MVTGKILRFKHIVHVWASSYPVFKPKICWFGTHRGLYCILDFELSDTVVHFREGDNVDHSEASLLRPGHCQSHRSGRVHHGNIPLYPFNLYSFPLYPFPLYFFPCFPFLFIPFHSIPFLFFLSFKFLLYSFLFLKFLFIP